MSNNEIEACQRKYKELEAGKKVTIIDTVTLEGLEVGTQYKLVGWQMLKEENAEILRRVNLLTVLTRLTK